MAHMVSAFSSGSGVLGMAPREGGRLDSGYGFGRRATLDTVLSSLTVGPENGVIILGEYGVGKTFVARQVIQTLSPDSLVLALRCSSITATMEYGALSPVMNEMADISLDNPLQVLRSLTKVLRDRADGRRIIFFVDNVQYLDDHTAMIITQLVAGGTASLLASCDSLASAPSEIIGLWRDGLVKRVDVAAFMAEETGPWLETMLDGPVAEAAVQALWNAGGGNPRFLEVIVQEQLDAGTLIRRDGVWVVTGAPFVRGPNSVDTVMTAFGTITSGEQMVVELLALSDGLPLNHLMGMCDIDSVDSLQQRGYLNIAHEEQGMVKLANRLMAQVLRDQVPTGRSRELYQKVTASEVVPENKGGASPAMITWGLQCGSALEFDLAMSAVRHATKSGFPGEALLILESLPRHALGAASILETARALVSLGELSRARLFVSSTSLDPDGLDLAQWTELMLLRSGSCRDVHQDGETPGLVLDQIRKRLDHEELSASAAGDGTAARAELATLRQSLAIGTIEQQLHAGRYREAAEDLERIYRHGLDAESRLKAGNWLVGAWMLTGRVTEAFKLAEEIGVLDLAEETENGELWLSDSALIFSVVASLTAEVHGHSRRWTRTGMFMGSRICAFAELAEGLIHIYNGRADMALERLLPAASQLDQLGESGAGALGSAAIAFAYALRGEDETALSYLNRSERHTAPSSRIIQVGYTYFSVLASAELGFKPKAILRLLALAENERQFRTAFVEMVIVHAAVRLGSTSGIDRLMDIAKNIQGPLARICEGFGRGLVDKDSALLLQVAGAAADLGDDLLARDIARAGLRISNENGDREGSRLAQQIIRGGVMNLGNVKVSSEDGQVLTMREQEIASQAAAGESNKEIAAKMHISVRTVEGHLYQVYSKLQLTSRTELREILA